MARNPLKIREYSLKRLSKGVNELLAALPWITLRESSNEIPSTLGFAFIEALIGIEIVAQSFLLSEHWINQKATEKRSEYEKSIKLPDKAMGKAPLLTAIELASRLGNISLKVIQEQEFIAREKAGETFSGNYSWEHFWMEEDMGEVKGLIYFLTYLLSDKREDEVEDLKRQVAERLERVEKELIAD